MSLPATMADCADLTSTTDRRASVRFVCGLNGQCQPATALEAGNAWPARATDISNGGVNLRMTRRFEVGTVLSLEFTSVPADSAYMPLLRICHVQPDGLYWRLGCVWARQLSAEDLRALIQPPEARVEEMKDMACAVSTET